jgi:hypothetical protein
MTRPRGTIEVRCTKCGWHFWVDALGQRMRLPFRCITTEGVDADIICTKCAGHTSPETKA